MTRERTFAAAVSRGQRSRVSNGSRWLEGLDGRSRECRRWRDLCRSLAAEIGGKPSEAQLAMIRATATAILASEQLQATIINGKAVAAELGELARLGNLVTRNLLALGLKRHKASGQDLRSYLKAKAAST